MAQTETGQTIQKLMGSLSVMLGCVMTCLRSHADEPRQLFVVPHRGLLLHAPENTSANFRACLELRIGFEFDVQRTKDGELVCVHDDTLNRAALDRLTHRCHNLETKSESYRLQDAKRRRRST